MTKSSGLKKTFGCCGFTDALRNLASGIVLWIATTLNKAAKAFKRLYDWLMSGGE